MFKVYDIDKSLETTVYDVSKSIGQSPRFLVYTEEGWQYEESSRYCPVEYAEQKHRNSKKFELKAEGHFLAEFTLDEVSSVQNIIMEYYGNDQGKMAQDNLTKQMVSDYLSNLNSFEVDGTVQIGDHFSVERVK